MKTSALRTKKKRASRARISPRWFRVHLPAVCDLSGIFSGAVSRGRKALRNEGIPRCRALAAVTLKFVRHIKLSLRYKIVALFFLAIVIPAIVFGIIITSISRRILHDSIFYRQQEIVSRLADRINYQLERHYKLLSLSQNIAVLPQPQQLSTARNLLVQGNAFSEISMVDTRGQELWKFRRGDGMAKDLINRSRRGEYRRARSGRGSISQVYFSDQHNPYIILSVPLKNRAGVLIAKLDFEQLWQWIAEVKIGETGEAFIVDRLGNLIAHREPERVLAHSNFSTLPVVRDFLVRRQPTPEQWREYHDERGQKVAAMYQTIPRLGWGVITQVPVSEIYQPIRRMQRNIAYWTLGWIALFLFVGYRFVKHIIDPLSHLQAGAHQISKGKLDIKLNIHTGDEIEDLARNFEKMGHSLKLLEDVRQDLTKMIIHDLKSPLSGIMGSLNYLESGMLGDLNGDQTRMVSLARKASESMLSMIQNLLDVAKMEEGKLELHREKADIGALVSERLNQYAGIAVNEKKAITVTVEPDLPEISIDRPLIERVVNNLLSNAIHHTSSGGAIDIQVRRIPKFLEVEVADNGAGIPEGYKEKIFEKFVQVERRQAHLRTGTGLGLTFCKMVIQTHGGTIRVESELNKGSAFFFTLPL